MRLFGLVKLYHDRLEQLFEHMNETFPGGFDQSNFESGIEYPWNRVLESGETSSSLAAQILTDERIQKEMGRVGDIIDTHDEQSAAASTSRRKHARTIEPED
eukprot:jgi/Hompol1/4301/HPOL_007035-RA